MKAQLTDFRECSVNQFTKEEGHYALDEVKNMSIHIAFKSTVGLPDLLLYEIIIGFVNRVKWHRAFINV